MSKSLILNIQYIWLLCFYELLLLKNNLELYFRQFIYTLTKRNYCNCFNQNTKSVCFSTDNLIIHGFDVMGHKFTHDYQCSAQTLI